MRFLRTNGHVSTEGPDAGQTGLDRRAMLSGALAVGLLAGRPALSKPANFFTSHRLPIGAQLYTVDELVRKDLLGSFDRLAAIGFTSIQLSGFHGHSPKELRSAADASGLTITSIHVGDAELGSTDDDARRLASDLAALGTRDVVMRMFIFPRDVARLPGEAFPSYLDRAVRAQGTEIWKRSAALLNTRGAVLKREGLHLGYHNHNCEFAPLEGTTGWQILTEETDPACVSFEMDAGWVAAAGLDPVKVISALKGRTKLIHVKDISAETKFNYGFTQVSAEIGSGIIDWSALLPAAYRAGVRQFYIEQEPPFVGDRFDALARSRAYLSR